MWLGRVVGGHWGGFWGHGESASTAVVCSIRCNCNYCEHGTEDFVQMICLACVRARSNGRCQTDVSDTATGARGL